MKPIYSATGALLLTLGASLLYVGTTLFVTATNAGVPGILGFLIIIFGLFLTPTGAAIMLYGLTKGVEG